jgi:hypothetical protein
MKILEVERLLKGTNPHEVALLQQQQDEGNTGAPHPGARKVEGRNACGECGGMSIAWGIDPFLKAALPTRIPSVATKSPPTSSRVPTPDAGAGSHMSCELTGNRRSQTAAHEAGNHPAVISVPPSSPKPAGKRADRYASGVQPHRGCAPLRLHRIRWVSMKARACMTCDRCNGCCVQRNRTATCANAASSRLRNQCRDSRQPCA